MPEHNDTTSHCAVSPASIRRALLTALAVGLLAAFLAPPPPPPAHAQGVDESLPPLADLTIDSEYDFDGGTLAIRPYWLVTVKNNTVEDHPGMHVDSVKVEITISEVIESVEIVRSTSTRIIRDLPPGGSKSIRVKSWQTIPAVTTGPAKAPQRLYAEIIESDPAEPPRFRFNNATEHWAVANRREVVVVRNPRAGVNRHTNGDVGVDVPVISDRFPRPGATTTFEVSAYTPSNEDLGIPELREQSIGQENIMFEVQVEISLSPGLSFAGTQPEAPSNLTASTTFATATGIWDVGTMVSGEAITLPVVVDLASDSLADLPLEERCLTAKVVRAVPWFANDPLKRQNDTATACLGVELLTEGEIILFYPYDCVGATTTPCTDDDTVEMLASLSDNFVQPESVIVHVRDPIGRVDDSHSGSVTSDGASWQTARDHVQGAHQVKGVKIGYTRAGFNDQIADWSSLVRTVTVSGLDGGTAPGRVKIRFNSSSGNVFFDPNPTHQRTPFNLRTTSTAISNYFLEFSALGAYVIEFTAKANRDDTTETPNFYTDTGRYIFHVGPIADLEVRDAGANPEVAAGRSAYTILAVNNGPDTAPAVRVTLGLDEASCAGNPTEGSIRFDSDENECVWTIGELRPGYDHRPSVHAAEGAALTLITATGDPITATIKNTRDYCVRIKTANIRPENDLECAAGSVPTGYTEHTAAYYDHIPGNSTTTVALRTGGLQGRHPGAPGGVKVTETPVANILTWQPVESVYEHAVTRYEVQRATSTWMTLASDVKGTVYEDMAPGSGAPEYRVRAVNDLGVPGPWSESSGRTPGVPKSFSASVAGSTQITLSWGAPDAVTGVSVAGYEIEVSSDGGATWTRLAAEHSASPYADNDGTLSPGATRDYRVRTVGAVGGKKLKSGWATARAEVPYPTPGVPKSFTASGSSDTQAALSWGAPDTVSGVSVTGYELDFSKDGGNDWNWLPAGATRTVLSASTLSHPHTDTTLGADAVRQYRLRAVGSVGGVTVRSGYTYAVATRDYPTPGAPRDFTALAVNRSQVNLSWSEPEAVSGVRLTGYHLEFSTDGNTWNRLPAAMSVLSTSTTRHEHVDAALSAGAIRQYRVRAVGQDSNNAVFESGWVFASAATDEVGAPRNLTATRDGIGRIDLAWDQPAFGASTITGYRIDYTLGSSDAWQTLEHGYQTSPRRHEHTGLSPGQEYCYRVAAIYVGGTGPFAERACATTEGAPANLPGKPENLRIAQVGSNYVTLEWDAPSVGGAAEYYEWRSNVHGPAEVSAASVTVRGLAPGSSYDFQVRAGNSYGPGGWSRHILVTLNRASSVVVVKASPAELEVEKRGSGSFNVRLNRSPQWPLALYTHSIGPECLTDQLAYQQGKIMLPDNLRPGKEFWEDGWWGPPDDRWAQSWRNGVDIRIDASGCQGGETTVVEYSLYTVPFSYLQGQPMWEELDLNEEEWREKWGVDPLDGISGPSVKVTVSDGD